MALTIPTKQEIEHAAECARYYRAGVDKAERAWNERLIKSRNENYAAGFKAGLEAAAKRFDGLTFGPYAHPSIAIRALIVPSDAQATADALPRPE